MLNDLRSQLGNSMLTMRRFLQRPARGERGGAASGRPAGSRAAQSPDDPHERVRRMRRDLYELMQRHPDSRTLMRHLDLVERSLRREGYAAVEALPVRVIAKALTQLERLVWDWTPAGLAELRSRLAVMVKNRQPEARAAAVELDMSSHHAAADVSEVDHAVFEEMERSWAGQMPEGVARAAAEAQR